MTGPQFAKRVCRPRDHVESMSRRFPGIWKEIDLIRGMCAADIPDSVYINSQILNSRIKNRPGLKIQELAMLASWRMTQGVYRIDYDVLNLLLDTEPCEDIPIDVLKYMPEWCIYIEIPDIGGESSLQGFFVGIDEDCFTGKKRVNFSIDTIECGLVSFCIPLDSSSLFDNIKNTYSDVLGSDLMSMHGLIGRYFSLLLYICSQASEIGGSAHRPVNPKPKRTKQGWKLFQADRPTTWDVGVRMGAALRRAYQAEQVAGDVGQHAGPRPHIRRAHWHGYWLGPKDGPRRFDLRWLPPIAVCVSDAGELPAVVRPVR